MLEVFNKVNERLLKGIKFHEQMADYFDFLNLHGLKREMEYHFFKESAKLRGLHRYVINHCNRLVNDIEIGTIKNIPSSWYSVEKLNIDNGTRRQAIKEAFEKWYEWEKSTKEFLQEQFKILTDNRKIASANKINELIQEVDKELKYLTRQMLEYKSVDYDLNYIVFQQNELHECYKEKTKNIGIDIC